MPILQICGQLERIRQSIEKDDSLLAYRIERIRQNIRLDFPSIQQPPNFIDQDPYPAFYPQERGPFITVARQNLFQEALKKNHLTQLEEIARQIIVAVTWAEKLALWARYVGLLSQLEWVRPQSMEDICNQENLLQAPKKLCRYMTLSGFLYTLLSQDKSRTWSNSEIREFARGLLSEVGKPIKYWPKLAYLWKDVRASIRNGLSFNIKPQRPHDVWFWTDGEQPVHTSGASPTSESAIKIVRDLGLPGWEKADDRLSKFGIVAIWTLDNPLCTYRPTLLDHLGSNCYFFLPGSRQHGSGLTWPLTSCCCYNDHNNLTGFKEWTAAMPADGIPAVLVYPNCNTPEPAFELAGLFFGSAHADLFTP